MVAHTPCSIIWDEHAKVWQGRVNWVKFIIDCLTLILILSVVGYIALKGRTSELKYVQLQMLLLLLAQILYCIRSFSRFYAQDVTYFGTTLPQWTEVCH